MKTIKILSINNIFSMIKRYLKFLLVNSMARNGL